MVASLIMTWSNARCIARRPERIAGASAGQALGPSDEIDEIDEIERVVDRLSSAVEMAEGESANREKFSSSVRVTTRGCSRPSQTPLRGSGVPAITVRLAAAVRVIQAHAGSVVRSAADVRIQLPATGAR